MKLRECIYASLIFFGLGEFTNLLNQFILRYKVNGGYWLSDAQSVDVYFIIHILADFFILSAFYIIVSGVYSTRKMSLSALILKCILAIFMYGKLIRFICALINKSYICNYEYAAYVLLIVVCVVYSILQRKKASNT